MFDRQDLRDCPACRMPDDVRALDAQGVHQTEHVGRQPLDRPPEPRLIALPDSAVIKGDYLEPPGKSGDLILPKGCKPGEPGDEQDGETHATPLVVERAVTDRNQRHRCAVQKVASGITGAGGLST